MALVLGCHQKIVLVTYLPTPQVRQTDDNMGPLVVRPSLIGDRISNVASTATNPLGATAAYMHGMGTIVRCPVCDTALIRLAHVKGRYFLDMRGVRVLQISAEA